MLLCQKSFDVTITYHLFLLSLHKFRTNDQQGKTEIYTFVGEKEKPQGRRGFRGRRSQGGWRSLASNVC